MQISIRHEYRADSDAVTAMMADEKWLSEVARRAGAESWEVSGSLEVSRVHAVVPAPERARRLTGEHLVIDLEIRWGAPVADGTRHGRLDVGLVKMPATMAGRGEMAPAVVNGQPGTAVEYDAEFAINVPLIGRSLETAAAPYVRRVIDTQQGVGNDYFAGRLG